MARPTSFNDIPADERFESIGSFNAGMISTSPALLKHYVGLIERLQKMHGRVERNKYNDGAVELYIPKDQIQLQRKLDSMQSSWDHAQRLYDKAVVRDDTGEEFREWERDTVVRFAENEGLPNPFDVFASHVRAWNPGKNSPRTREQQVREK